MKKRAFAIAFVICLITLFATNEYVKVYANSDTIIATYTTEFGEWDIPRTKNIRLSAQAIDHKIIKSGEIFSFNDIVGDRTAEKGYEESTVFVYDQKVKGIGGGVCQVSTTLYNTALYSNLEIVERHTHKREIYYAPKGRDATVDYPKLDLKIKNNYSFDVKIRAYTSGSKLTVEILKVM